MSLSPLDINTVRQLRESLGDAVVTTPVMRAWALEEALGDGSRVYAKLEFLQRTGTFKARGALATLKRLSPGQLAAGVTAVSAGNHAIATAYAAAVVGTSAKVVMIRNANPARLEACRSYGAEVVLADDVHAAFEVAERIESEEGRYLVHPFEGEAVATGTGTLGLEIAEQCDDIEALVITVGGGGLIGGIANVFKQLRPSVQVIGVEPEGADTMHRSFAAGEPRGIDEVKTIADSLGAPFAMPYSFALCRDNVDRLVKVSDDALRRAMGFMFRHMKLAVEPACAASTAALLGPLRQDLAGRSVAVLLCGSNVDWPTFAAQVRFDD